MPFCSKCGNQLPDDAAFCGECGNPVGKNVTGGNVLADGGDIPVFTPPKSSAPIFQPPRRNDHNGAVCYHHPAEPAVAQCARCGKYICKDCAEAYSVTDGEYAGKCLCYDCCRELVAQDVEELTANKKVIKKHFTIQIIGMSIGFIIGMLIGISQGLAIGSVGGFFYGILIGFIQGIMLGCIGGVFWSYLKAVLIAEWEAFKMLFTGNWISALIYLFIMSFILGFKAVYSSIKNTIFYIKYLKETSSIIEEDTVALQQMRDYMEYTLVRGRNKGVDLESLMNEGSELYNNSYAQAVRTNGEEAADAVLRQATTRIAENGEIIRDFPAAA